MEPECIYSKYLRLFNECLNKNYTHSEEAGSYNFEIVGDTLKIWFEWSGSHSDWLNNFDFPKVPYKEMETEWKVHRGFLRVFKSIEPYIKSAIMCEYISKIQIVGYSHGAALAMLCHEYCIYNRPDCEVEGFGFGCPRVLYGKYPDELLKRWENFTVIRNMDDVVTHVPPELFGFHHVGQVVDLTPFGYYIKSEKKFKEKFVAGHRPENIIKQLENKISGS
jgi:hypothetical protein